jgi:putative component of membrane protein insertase Oxa1/YidC/SpoIIIJ protein YidD
MLGQSHAVLDYTIALHASNQKNKREKLNFSGKQTWKNYNPIHIGLSNIMYLYQNNISELMNIQCIYHESCSEFSKLSIQKYGYFKGVFLTLDRLSRCTHWAHKEEKKKKFFTFPIFDSHIHYTLRD